MKPFLKTVVITSLIAGTLDILCAYVQFYIATLQVSKKMFNYIAAGALGVNNAMNGGLGIIFLGVFFHYFIAFFFTLFFFLIYRKFNVAGLNRYVAGLLYGIFIWIIMNLIVLPLSMIPPRPFNPKNAMAGALILMLMVGLPISLSAHNYFKKAKILKIKT